jgi:diguanylate cyclase
MLQQTAHSIEKVNDVEAYARSKTFARRAAQRRTAYIAQAFSYIIDAGILAAYFYAGTTSLAVSFVYLIGGLTETAIALWLSETNFNDRFKDHYLTVPHSICGITIQLAAVYFAPEVGFYFICILFVILGFGALRMSALQAAYVWTYSTIGLTALFLLFDKAIALPTSSWAERALALACIVTALGRFASVGLYGSSMREALYKRGKELREAHARIEELAQLDELTGLLNRRYIMKSLDEELIRAQRNGPPCSVALIDLDFFKRVNDEFGHPVGDEALRTFAVALLANIRPIDRLGRYGGEEFLLIMPDTPANEAARTLERLRMMIAELNWAAIAENMHLTMSAGICAARQDASPADILARADAALYRAKDAGRNCVMTA